jgi:hypothetical protein
MKHLTERGTAQSRGRQKVGGFSALRSLGSIALALAISGCAMLQPHVHEDELFEVTYSAEDQMVAGSDTKKKPNAAAVTFAGDLANAIDDANRQRVAYLDAAGQYSLARNTAPLLATGLGAAALFMTITTGGISDTAAGLGLGSAGTIGLAMYYDNRPRQMVYISGADAIGCAIVAQRPLLMLAEDYNAFVIDLNDLESGLAKLAGERAKYGARATWIVLENGYRPEDVDDVLAKGRVIYSGGVALKTSINTAGLGLREKVISIVTAVDREIVKTDPDPKGITNILASLAPSAEAIVPGLLALPKPKAAPAASEQQADEVLTQEQIDFKNLVDMVRQKSQLVALRVERAQTLGDITASLEACTPAEAQSTIRIFPDEAGIVDIPAGGSRTYTVLGGAGIPRVGVAGDFPAGKVNSSMSLSNGTVQVVVTSAADATGSGQIIIGDSSDLAPKIVNFRIIPKEEAALAETDTEEEAGEPEPQSNLEPAPQPEEDTGGDVSSTGPPATIGSISKAEAKLMTGPRTPVEITMMSGEVSKIAALRCRLGVGGAPDNEPTSLFDASFREKVFEFQEAAVAQGVAVIPSGLIDEPTLASLSHIPPPANC